MSAPKPLYSLVEQFRAWAVANMEGFTEQALAVQHRADELEAALLAWDEHVATLKADTAIWHGGPFVRQQILGLPAKEPQSQDETSFPQALK